ncbi:uncharacterized protein Z520_05203 [Fonsecaea multimorphosa CBS 102226]|uniref:Uncharacterized protein n=1 Tax=Fonsecaea multimorphosa CBS 102226 TaxID=1442371 RepID=A0A0D2JYY8_9EURO|nr:uncharacterized protein Z520_05203 [Fonsecaea multimorphosa CBS 102226]KIX98742.1 hypothetical protein Z520_05203 [Fonsecaea multimorphosa CBS 102226]
MSRHAQKDEEAGGPGLGVLETRKRSFRDAGGIIVTRPRKKSQKRESAPEYPSKTRTLQLGQDAFSVSESEPQQTMSPPPSEILEISPQAASVSEAHSGNKHSDQLPDYDGSWLLDKEHTELVFSQDTAQSSQQEKVQDPISLDGLFYEGTGKSYF